MRRVVGVFAVATLVVGACGLGLVGTAGAGETDPNAPILRVQKVVTGTSASGFTVVVQCASDPVVPGSPFTLRFLANGKADPSNPQPGPGWVDNAGVWKLQVPELGKAACTVSETGTGGAASTSYACAFTPGTTSTTGTDPVGVGCPGSASGPSSTPAVVTYAHACSFATNPTTPCANGSSALVTVTNTFPVVAAPVITALTQDANSVLVTGSGFPPNTGVTVDIQSTPLVLGTLTADANGAFSKTFTIPCSVGSGSHTVTATAATGQKASTGVTLAACPVVAAIKFTG